MGDFAAWQADATADEQAVAVCFNRALYRRFWEASDRLEQIHQPGMLTQTDEYLALAGEVVDLKRQVEADQADHTFVFATVPYSQWAKLLEDHPATPEQKADNKYADHNPDTFQPVALAASCVEPGLTEDQAGWLREHLPRQEFERLVGAVWTVNVGGSSIPKSVAGIVNRLDSELNSTMPQDMESPSPSSEDA
jgi:hypothetical protein